MESVIDDMLDDARADIKYLRDEISDYHDRPYQMREYSAPQIDQREYHKGIESDRRAHHIEYRKRKVHKSVLS